jgi:hypothetical protein
MDTREPTSPSLTLDPAVLARAVCAALGSGLASQRQLRSSTVGCSSGSATWPTGGAGPRGKPSPASRSTRSCLTRPGSSPTCSILWTRLTTCCVRSNEIYLNNSSWPLVADRCDSGLGLVRVDEMTNTESTS